MYPGTSVGPSSSLFGVVVVQSIILSLTVWIPAPIVTTAVSFLPLSARSTAALFAKGGCWTYPASLRVRERLGQQSRDNLLDTNLWPESSHHSQQSPVPPTRKRPPGPDQLLNAAIDTFLYSDSNQLDGADHPKTPYPHRELKPGQVIELALRSLRHLHEPEPFHGAAIFQQFCLPLTRAERWADRSTLGHNPWKDVLQEALTPTLLNSRIRASEFCDLLDWDRLDVTDGAMSSERGALTGLPGLAVVHAALYFSGDGIPPSLVTFTLRRKAGVWLVDTARKSRTELLAQTQH